MKLYLGLLIGLLLGWSFTTAAEILDSNGLPMQPPSHWAPMTQSQQQQLNWQLQQNFNNALQQPRRNPC